jgi:hypothetical protein
MTLQLLITQKDYRELDVGAVGPRNPAIAVSCRRFPTGLVIRVCRGQVTIRWGVDLFGISIRALVDVGEYHECYWDCVMSRDSDEEPMDLSG